MSPYADILKASGLRCSTATVAVLEEMGALPHPVSLLELQARPRLQGWNASTLYRTVMRLEKAGLIRRNTLLGRSASFELTRDRSGSVYLVCDHCGQLSRADTEDLNKMARKLQRLAHWQHTYFEFSLHGICPRCGEEEEAGKSASSATSEEISLQPA